MSEQYDHHCLISFNGLNWRIMKCRPNGICVRRQHLHMAGIWYGQWIDTSKVDWDKYCTEAVLWDYRNEDEFKQIKACNHNIADFASLFLNIATPDEIKAERTRLEALYGQQLKVFEVEHPTHSGTKCTRVTWEIA